MFRSNYTVQRKNDYDGKKQEGRRMLQRMTTGIVSLICVSALLACATPQERADRTADRVERRGDRHIDRKIDDSVDTFFDRIFR